MQVLLKRNWFTPLGRFKKSATKKGPPVEIPDSLRGRLPSDAIVVDDEGRQLVYEDDDKPQTLSAAAAAFGIDLERTSAEAENKVYEAAGMPVRKSTVQQVQANAVKFQKELDAENAVAPPPPMSKAAKKRAEMQAEVDAHNAKGRS